MDPVLLLFRLVAKITTLEGAILRRPHPYLDPVEGGSIREHVGLGLSPLDDLRHAVLVLEVLLSAILAVYASITLAYAVRYYKKLWYSADDHHHDKHPLNRNHHNPRYIDRCEV